MYKIDKHPILEIPHTPRVTFKYNDHKIESEKGFSIAAALHQAGFPIHSHSIQGRERSLECGIGKCGACEMLVDGQIRRICCTKVDNVKLVTEIPDNYIPPIQKTDPEKAFNVYKTSVAIVGAGPAGLAAREILNNHNIGNIVVDNNDMIGGQFNMQTHQFFFFEKEQKYGGMRGFEIASTLAGEDHSGIILSTVVWDILDGKRLALKNIQTNEISFLEADYLIIATGAVPFVPAFENDDLPGVYTAAVIQKMMNTEFTLLGKNILTVGAGNIGYLTSYQLMQAGATVKAIIEAQPNEGGFPVQANRVRRLGIPVLTSHMLIKAIPNEKHDGVTGAVIAESKNFKPVPGTERIIDGIDAINICTGLISDSQLVTKGEIVFGKACVGAGDAVRIGEGTSAVLRGKQAAFDVIEQIGIRNNYDNYLELSKEYIDSQQHPVKVLNKAKEPDKERMNGKPFVIIDCLYGFACNPCSFACPHGAITKSSTSTVPVIDYEKCIGCMKCVNRCPGLAIFGYNIKNDTAFFPIEYEANEGDEVYLIDNQGNKLGEGKIKRITKHNNKTNVALVQSINLLGEDLKNARGFIVKTNYPEPIDLKSITKDIPAETYVCHCEDVTLDEVLRIIGDRKVVSVDEIKHTTRIGMGVCRGKRCIPRLRQLLRGYNITVLSEPTPRAPLSNQINLGDLYPKSVPEEYIISKKEIKKENVKVLVAGGGIGGSALFRYFAEAGLNPVLINNEAGSSWRNIAGGRPAFSVPELSDIARHNNQLFKELQNISNINYREIKYVTFAHDQATYNNLDLSRSWSDAYMIEPKDFAKEISPYISTNLNKKYMSALISNECWQATPGIVVDVIRKIGINHGGTLKESTKLIDVHKNNTDKYIVLVQNDDRTYTEYTAEHFVNALGGNADKFAKKLGIITGAYPVKHQAFITRRLPFLGINNSPLGMLIDRQKYKGYTAIYGQQLEETGQIIACASPAFDPQEAGKDLRTNDKDFLEIASEVFTDWIPQLSSVSFQACWSGYYVEPRMIIDPSQGLFIGLKGQGFMLGQYLARLYVDKYLNNTVPEYFDRLKIEGDGLLEVAFK
ncbi:MAG: FAD-dependent oxidoreductase [Bacteroidales bacterium]|jgi:glycine/D-amino acid oxidase-like deaminating enzyme/Fe-S-cluster-containing hydrogenase component 2/bacterioferritin-associated ferredoxin/ferredoxin|nr:FAD-dependent oxidoreductase [Bacteroidales bacterium]